MSRASTLAKAVGANGDIATSGNTTLGDASTDSITINAATANIPNGINFASGNIGVGGTPGAWRTDYSTKAIQVGPVGAFLSLSASTTNNQTFLSSNLIFGTGGTYSRINADWGSLYQQIGGQHLWFTTAAQTGSVSMNQLMTLNSSGFLGIGQTNPAYSIDILANTGNLLIHQTRQLVIDTTRNLGGIVGSGYSVGTTVVDSAQLNFSSESAWSSTSAPSCITFGTTPSGSITMQERARIDSTGRLLVGVNSGTGNYFVDVANGANDTYIRAQTSGNTSGFVSKNNTNTYFAGVYYSSSGSYQIYDMTNGADRLTVKPSGNIGIGKINPSELLDVYGGVRFGQGNSGIFSTVYTYTSGAYNLCSYGTGAGGSQFLVMINGHGGTAATQTAIYNVSVHYDGTLFTATNITGSTYTFDVSGGYLRITSGSYNWFYTVTIIRNDY